MTPERWKRISHVYEAAHARPATERAGFVAQACGSDETLRLEVQALLDQPTSPPFLEKLTPAVVADAVGDQVGSNMSGRRFGAYLLHERIGAGGMGEVYRARDTRLGRDVAIKVLPRGFADDPDRLARFQREAEVLASLIHPNIGGHLRTGRRRRHQGPRDGARRRGDLSRAARARSDTDSTTHC